MKIQSYGSDVPQLRVFWGEDQGAIDDRRPPEPNGEPPRDWPQDDAYWAGRNRAGRHSARLAA